MILTRTEIKSTIRFTVTFQLDEMQARALDALVGYGVESFLKVFYKYMGRHYLEPYEMGLRSLFKTVNEQVEPELYRIKCMRKALADLEKPKAKGGGPG